MPEIIPERAKLARQLCRFSMDDLVREMGDSAISKMAVSKIERGLLRPSSSTLQAIAKACRQPVEFFYKPFLNLGTTEYRFKDGVTLKQRKEIKALTDELLQQYFELQTLEADTLTFTHPMGNTILHNYADAEKAAIKLRHKWEIGKQPIHSVYELLFCYGIHVLEIDLGCTNVDGLSTFVNKTIPIIIVNIRTNTTTERKRFTALHELCHLLFRLRPDNAERHRAYLDNLKPIPYTVTIKQPTEERLCDLFASAMLMPEDCVLRRFGKIRTDVSIQEFIATRNLYGISIAAQVHRLHDLRVIDDDLYAYFYEVPIKQNRLEENWGLYPIMEKADRMSMLEERLKVELERSKKV